MPSGDFASLNNAPMLPWDVWGAMPGINEAIPDDLAALIDHIAAISQVTDSHFDEMRALYQDERLKVPAQVFNANRNRFETV